eukprot:scaffold18078_cov66-Cylindrotheca_fusiformis.AAC.1
MVANLSKIAVPFVESYMTFKTGFCMGHDEFSPRVHKYDDVQHTTNRSKNSVNVQESIIPRCTQNVAHGLHATLTLYLFERTTNQQRTLLLARMQSKRTHIYILVTQLGSEDHNQTY